MKQRLFFIVPSPPLQLLHRLYKKQNTAHGYKPYKTCTKLFMFPSHSHPPSVSIPPPVYQLLSCIDDISAHNRLTAETVYPLWTVTNDPITSLVLYWQQLRDGQTTHTNWSKKAVCTPIIHYSTLDIWSIKVNMSPWLPCGVLCQYPSVIN